MLPGAYAAPPGAVVSNTASVDYLDIAGLTVTVTSNTVEVTTAVARSPASIAFTRVAGAGNGAWQEPVGPAACNDGGTFVTLPDPVLPGGVVIDPAQVQDLEIAASYNLGDPLFVRLEDADQNVDFQVADTAVVTVSHAASGDTEIIRLTETGANTGIFAGYVPSARGTANPGDCILQGTLDSSVSVTYTDPADAADSAAATAVVDPVSVVFESRTGTVVDAVRMTLVDAATGQPALVYGNDGTSIFPASITTGTTVTDSSGASYAFGPGQFRFPVVPPGNYRLVAEPPPDYAFPSGVPLGDLQALPGASFTLGDASFGAVFSQPSGGVVDWDIPVDPQAGALFLTKETTVTVAAPGDFVRYELEIENASSIGGVSDVRISDRLPAGVRFVAGSARLDGTEIPDPVISADRRSLEFPIAALATGERAAITYVVEIVGGQRDDELINRATAVASGGLVSNEASAMIRLTEDLFRSTGTIIGRVLEADCSQETFSEEQGVANVRVYLEDGRYAVTDEGGRFHFEGIAPGTHVAQLDTYTVPAYFDVVGCGDTPGFAGRADSRFVKLSRGSLKRADFFVRKKPRPEGRVDIELRNHGTDSTEQVAYTLDIEGSGNVAIDNIGVRILLPDGVRYVPGSMRIDGRDLGEPRISGPVMSLALDDRFGNWSSTVTFTADIASDVSGELVTRAVLAFDSALESGQETPVAMTRMIREPALSKNEGYVLDLKFAVLSDELSPEDKLQLDLLIEDWQGVRDIRIGAVGHSDSQPIATRNRHLFADNYVLSEARAQAAARYVAEALDVPMQNIQVEGRGPDEPVASNASAAGRQANRRVEMVMSGVRPSKPSFLEVVQESSGTQVTPTVGALPGENERRRRIPQIDPDAGMPASQVEPPLETLRPGIDLLLPAEGFRPAIAATKISVQHAPGQTIKVYVNERPVNPLTFDSTAVNRARTVAVSRWKGVDLDDGANVIRVVVSNPDGSRARGMQREIYYSGQPIRGEIVTAESTLLADGKTVPVIAVRLYDRAGRPSRSGTVGAYWVDAPYRSLWDVENERRNELVAIGSREPTYRVGPDGIAWIELEPTSQSGEVTLNLKFGELREQQLRAWLKPAARDWILVGFAEGTAAYNTLADNMDAAAEAGFEDGYADDGRIAFFAKGSIRGEYLLTLAYDSDRDTEASRERFATVIDPNRYYPLFADTSEQRFEAPSQRKLYVKLERGQFNALFGDFATGLSVTDLARYERRFNGLKSEYRGETFGYTAFAAESAQTFRRDEIQGEGTSGLYRLSAVPVIANSDKIRLEVRDRFDSGVVLSQRQLTRYVDYNLDPLAGTIFFKEPVPSRDTDFNPVYIVIEYETLSGGAEDLVAGGRFSARSAADAVEVGVTRIDDSTTGAEGELTGVDLRWRLNEQTLVRAEVAESSATEGAVERDGRAHKVELEHNGERLDLEAYIREVEAGFGLGYQSAADRGFRRLGVDLRGDLGDAFRADAEAGWQQNLDTGDIRNLARAQLRYSRESLSATLGLTHAEDQFDDGDRRVSSLGELGLAKQLMEGRLTLRASKSTPFSGDAESADFPSRLVLGADYRLVEGVDLVAEYEDASGRDIDATMTRLGVRATPWHRAQINTLVTEEVTEFGPRLFANVGLLQGFRLNERWSLDVGLDQTNTLAGADLRELDADRVLASGSRSEDFLAFFLGALYTADAWSANWRLEHRNSDNEERNLLLLGWYREPSVGHGLSAGLTFVTSDSVTGTERTSADLRIGWAYRMADSAWAFLNRTDLVYEDTVAGAEGLESWRLVNNFNANRRFGAAAELSLQYAFKLVESDFDGDSYGGYTDLAGVDLRRGVRDRWDVGVHASVYHSWESGVFDYSAGADVGFNLLENVWLTLGYNATGFYDSDFTEARYTAQGPYLRFSFKADQDSLKRIAGR